MLGKRGSALGKNPREVQILSDDHRPVGGCVVENPFVGITGVSNGGPMRGFVSEGSEVMGPACGKVLVEDQLHVVRISWVSAAVMSAANSRAARMDSGVRDE